MGRVQVFGAVCLLGLLIGCGTQRDPAGRVSQDGLSAQHAPGGSSGGIGQVGTYGDFSLVGEVAVRDARPGLVADLAAHPGKPYAYLARWGGDQCPGPEKRGQQLPDGGAYVIDISDPARPREVGFIPVHQDTLVGEGMQVLKLRTPRFTGDVLVMNHEGCGRNYKAGFSLVDVTNPLKPMKLAMHEGDFTREGQLNTPHDANQYHSAFAWMAGDRAYLVATDDEERQDVDIYDISNPRQPRLLTELDLNQFAITQPQLGLVESFLHDMVVKKIGADFYMLLSYWDGGYVLLNVNNPAAPVFLGDSEYAAIDPELLARTGVALTPEGNGHQAEFTSDNRFVIATDEDFDPFRLAVQAGGQLYNVRLGTNTPPTSASSLVGPTVFVGRACTGDPSVPVGGAGRIAVVERGLCTFEEKAQNVLAAGNYAGLVIMNREGPDACVAVFSPSLSAPLPTALIGRDAGFALFGRIFDSAACLDATPQLSGIPIGTPGLPITSVQPQFDGWGYVHLFGVDLATGSLTGLDTFAIPEAMDPAFARNSGDLSVHEVATDPTDNDLAYLSYYAGGLRVVQIQCTPDCQLVDVAGYTNPASSFWGVEVWTHPGTGQEYVLGSDRNSGLKIFRYTGP